MSNEPIEILLVEDNPADARLTVEAFKEGKVPTSMSTVSDGENAMSYLRREGEYANATRPDIILLDLNLPRKDGREVLAEIKQDPDLRRIPVIILSISNNEQDIVAAYDLHANCYIAKPVDLDRFFDIVRSIEDFWLATVRLPDGKSV